MRLLKGKFLMVWLLAYFSGFACKTANHSSELSQGFSGVSCEKGVDILPFLKKRYACTSQNFRDDKRHLYRPLPCNQITLVHHPENITDNHKASIAWLSSQPEFTLQEARRTLSNPGQPASVFSASPIADHKVHKQLVEMIDNAKETIFFDMFLLGGYWGADVARHLVLAAERGVDVLVLRDTENPFGFAAEILPLWQALKEYKSTSDKGSFVVLRSEIHKRPSGLPFGAGRFLKPFLVNVNDKGTTPLLQSDHSKLLIVDGLSKTPSMFIGSKNMADHGSGINFDESVFLKGPTAGLTQLAYLRDLELAYSLAEKEKSLAADGMKTLSSWIERIKALKGASSHIVEGYADGLAAQLVENNADDSIRNAETTFLRLINTSSKEVGFYSMGLIPFGGNLADAIVDAQRRGVNIRAILDPLTGELSGKLLRRALIKRGLAEATVDRMIRWRVVRDGWVAEESPTGIVIRQQQHTKTLIADDRVQLGSVNFDMMTFGGAFRETSLVVHGGEVVSDAKRNFEALFSDPTLTITYAEAFPDEKTSLKQEALARAVDAYQKLSALVKANVDSSKLGSDSCY